MMDPASIVGIIGSVVGIADIVTRSIRRLSTLKTKFRDVPFLVTTLTGQLCTVQAALDQLSVWAARDLTTDTRYRKLATQVGDALDCFDPLIKALESRLDRIEGIGEGQVDLSRKVSFLWTEKELVDYLSLLDRQVNALTLLLQALQCKTFLEQEKIITESDGQTILRLARDRTSSIRGFDDTSCYDNASLLSEDTNALSSRFDFDSILLSSNIYQAVQRSHLKQLIRSKGRQDENRENSTARSHLDLFPDSKPGGNASEERRLRGLRSSLGIREPNTRDLQHKRRDPENAEYLQRENGLRRPPRPRRQRRNIFLAGTNNSGKSILLKGFKILEDGGVHNFSPEERIKWKDIICRNIMDELTKTLITMDEHGIRLENETNMPHAEKLSTQSEGRKELSLDIVQAIEALWSDLGVQRCHHRRGFDFHPDPNISYWVNEIRRLTAQGYQPSLEDILKTGLKTTGVHRTSLKFDGEPYEFFEVGGTRAERKKWDHTMYDIHLVFFLVDATGYNKCLPEDRKSSHMLESCKLLESLFNSEYCESWRFVIVFTHQDQLYKELVYHSPNEYGLASDRGPPGFPGFPDAPYVPFSFKDELDLEYEYMKYLEARFMELAPKSKRAHMRMVWANLVNPKTADIQHIFGVMRELLSYTI
ncbi:hypothetical protein EV356DRAFT_472529 [Viridothelium virens]|uniref:G-alpha-domain-containing protein n=1 Tax=Viridothelium virens TaxID=1048519 RepID=A0A6A6GZ24_VIRVR|nr:hypothetical protein EV356DRAFT_472529 [Viridothelium virens]